MVKTKSVDCGTAKEDMSERQSASQMCPFDKEIMEILDRRQKHVGIDEYLDGPYRATRHHDSMVNTIRAIREHGRSWKDLEGAKDKDFIKDYHRYLDSGASLAYGIREWNESAPTMTTRCAAMISGRFTHPSEDRAITYREVALLIGFPV